MLIDAANVPATASTCQTDLCRLNLVARERKEHKDSQTGLLISPPFLRVPSLRSLRSFAALRFPALFSGGISRSLGGVKLRPALLYWLALALLSAGLGRARAAAPVVSNVRAAQRAGTPWVDVYYDLADADSSALTVSIAVSTNGGASYTLTGPNFTGALGAGVAPGSNKKITWNAGVDLPAKLFSTVRVSVTASDDTVPAGMALIPAGSFTMGDTLSEGSSSELPLHTVYVSAFYMDRTEVTKALWDDVYNWAITHGYSFDAGSLGLGKASTHPVQTVSWYDCVKWCNARSEKEGRTWAYYTNAAQTAVYRSGQINVSNTWVNWNVGYRLPTEAEWEKAARGGASGHRFPWSDAETITHSRANYYSSTSYAYDTSPTRGYHPTFTGVTPYTSPAGYFAPNGYGLYDMEGNVAEWCWDWYSSTYYNPSPGSDPRGPTSGSDRVFRGDDWANRANRCRSAFRFAVMGRSNGLGFRSVLPPGQ